MRKIWNLVTFPRSYQNETKTFPTSKWTPTARTYVKYSYHRVLPAPALSAPKETRRAKKENNKQKTDAGITKEEFVVSGALSRRNSQDTVTRDQYCLGLTTPRDIVQKYKGWGRKPTLSQGKQHLQHINASRHTSRSSKIMINSGFHQSITGYGIEYAIM